MVNISKKTISLISGTTIAITGGTTISTKFFLQKENNIDTTKKSLIRNKDYHQYTISQKINKFINVNDIVDSNYDSQNIKYILNENKFLHSIKVAAIESLKSTTTFAKNYMNYKIECNYKIINDTVLVDIVWYLPNSQNKYFDQFQIILFND